MTHTINLKPFNHFPKLETERLLFDWIRSEDAQGLFAVRSNQQVMRYMGLDPMQSVADAEKFIESIDSSYKERRGLNWKVVEKETNRFAGYFGFWRIDAKHCRGEVGFALHPDMWGKGYMRETMLEMIAFGFRQLNLHSMEANVDPENVRSIALLEGTGWRKEAYFRENYLYNGHFLDSVIYSLLEKDIVKD